MQICSYQSRDLPALYRICLATGMAGKDVSEFYRDPLLVGHVYAAPHAIFALDCCFAAEDDDGIGGYIVGAADADVFERRLESDWRPAISDGLKPAKRPRCAISRAQPESGRQLSCRRSVCS